MSGRIISRVVALAVAFSATVSLCSCAGDAKFTTSSKLMSDSSVTDSNSDISAVIPEEIKQIKQRYSDVLSANSFAFKLDDNNTYEYKKNTTGSVATYDIFFLFPADKEQDSRCNLRFHYYGGSQFSRAYIDIENGMECSDAVLDFLTATILVYDSKENMRSAYSTAKKAMHNFGADSFSDNIDIDNFIICLSPNSKSNTCSLNIVDMNILREESEKSQCLLMTDELYKSSISSSSPNFYFIGKIVSIKKICSSSGSISKQMVVKSDYGKEYTIYQTYESVPIDYEAGKTYTFYGYVVNNSSGEYEYYGDDFFYLKYAE